MARLFIRDNGWSWSCTVSMNGRFSKDNAATDLQNLNVFQVGSPSVTLVNITCYDAIQANKNEQ